MQIGLSEWPSWQRRKSCGNSRTFDWVRVQLQTGELSLLFSDNTQVPHLNLKNRRYPSVFGYWAPVLKGRRMLSGKCWNHFKWRYADPDALACLHRWCPDSFLWAVVSQAIPLPTGLQPVALLKCRWVRPTLLGKGWSCTSVVLWRNVRFALGSQFY